MVKYKYKYDNDTNGHLITSVKYKLQNGFKCELARTRHDYLACCVITGGTTNCKYTLYINGKSLGSNYFFSEFIHDENKISVIHNQLVNEDFQNK
tara:strand:+ start:559 stop:843 length:285 start_codon:yes stop_codon:yes gene_type:complete